MNKDVWLCHDTCVTTPAFGHPCFKFDYNNLTINYLCVLRHPIWVTQRCFLVLLQHVCKKKKESVWYHKCCCG